MNMKYQNLATCMTSFGFFLFVFGLAIGLENKSICRSNGTFWKCSFYCSLNFRWISFICRGCSWAVWLVLNEPCSDTWLMSHHRFMSCTPWACFVESIGMLKSGTCCVWHWAAALTHVWDQDCDIFVQSLSNCCRCLNSLVDIKDIQSFCSFHCSSSNTVIGLLTVCVCVVIVRVCSEALAYFISLTSESHREAWNSLLMLLLTRTLRLPDNKARMHKQDASCYTLVRNAVLKSCIVGWTGAFQSRG